MQCKKWVLMQCRSLCICTAGNGYLCSVRPSVYAQYYEEHLPDSIVGAEFLKKYHHHYDQATQVSGSIPSIVCLSDGAPFVFTLFATDAVFLSVPQHKGVFALSFCMYAKHWCRSGSKFTFGRYLQQSSQFAAWTQ